MSNAFANHSGFPQGSLLSLKLYNIIMDDVFDALQESGLNCYVNLTFTTTTACTLHKDMVLHFASLI